MSTANLAPIDRKIETELTSLAQRAQAMQVVDSESYAEAGQIVVAGRAEIKAIGFALDPGIDSARRHLDELRNQKAAFVNRVQAHVVSVVEQRMEAWKRQEREAAQREQDRINAENRRLAAERAERERKEAEAKAEEDRKQRAKEIEAARKAGDVGKREAERLKKEAEAEATRQKEQAARDAEITRTSVQEVKVAPAVPKVAGIRARVNWTFTVSDANKLPRMYMKADEVAIGSRVRAIKDKAKAEAEIPGITVESVDSI